MDNKKIEGAGSFNASAKGVGHNLPSSNNANASNPKTIALKPLDVSSYPLSVGTIRASIYAGESLRKLIEWQKNKELEDKDYFTTSLLEPDSKLKGALEDLENVFFKEGLNLRQTLKSSLVKSNDLYEKEILAKALIALEEEDYFTNNFLLPSLEKRTGFLNLEVNHQFTLELLRSVSNDEREYIFEKIKYENIKDKNNFAETLSKIIEPNLMVDLLIRIDEKLTLPVFENEDGDERLKKRKEALQGIVIKLMQILNGGNFQVLLKDLKKLYNSFIDDELCKEVIQLISERKDAESINSLRELMLEKNDHSELSRRKQFDVLGYYAKQNKEFAVPTLKEFIEKEKDPFSVGHACYWLLNDCGIDGKRALLQVILKQIKNNIPSIPLACLTQMVVNGDPYRLAFKQLLLIGFDKEHNLKEAYLNLLNTLLGKIEKHAMLFHLDEEEIPDLLPDLIENLGIHKLLKWAVAGAGKSEIENENSKKNVKDILEAGFEINKTKLKKLLTEAILLANPNQVKLIHKVAGF